METPDLVQKAKKMASQMQEKDYMPDLRNAKNAMKFLASYNMLEDVKKNKDGNFNYTPSKILVFLILLLGKKYEDDVKRLAIFLFSVLQHPHFRIMK